MIKTKMLEKCYEIKIQDFTPGVGSLIFQDRNMKRFHPKYAEQHIERYIIGVSLTLIDSITGFFAVQGIIKGLEELVQKIL